MDVKSNTDKVCIIGAGSSGLAAAKTFSERGIPFDCLEREGDIGGLWNEATNTGYARKTLTDASLAALPSPDDTNDRYEVDIPDQTWTGVANDGTGAIAKLLVCYDSDTTGGTDANIVPLTAHDFVKTPNGGDITAEVHASGFFRAG